MPNKEDRKGLLTISTIQIIIEKPNQNHPYVQSVQVSSTSQSNVKKGDVDEQKS
jgi:hypothetical protein